MAGPDSREAIVALAAEALDTRREAEALPRVAAFLAAHPDDPGVLHWTALLHRELDQRERALPLLRRALALAPGDAGLVHAVAQVELEAGLPAARSFEAAVQLAPSRPDVRLGWIAALLAEGRGDRARDQLAALLQGNPGWIEGHRQFAQLAAVTGAREHMLDPLMGALGSHPQALELHQLAAQLLLDAEEPAAAAESAARGLRGFPDDPGLRLAQAAAWDEMGEWTKADLLLEPFAGSMETPVLVRRARHLLRVHEAERVSSELEPHLDAMGAENLWPYAALAWRLAGDPRSDWLDGQPGLISATDLDPEDLDLDAIRSTLNRLHAGSGRFLDQSVRGGSQTSGVLFARIEPELARLREALRTAVSRHIAALPPIDRAHPTLARRRDAGVRFAGSWSVRLQAAGHHAAHHHPQGWLSSAFYVTVPPAREDRGVLEIGGGPADLGLDLAPRLTVQPEPGRLVIFPSWLWHGTRPFSEGERMTVAFDVAPS